MDQSAVMHMGCAAVGSTLPSVLPFHVLIILYKFIPSFYFFTGFLKNKINAIPTGGTTESCKSTFPLHMIARVQHISVTGPRQAQTPTRARAE